MATAPSQADSPPPAAGQASAQLERSTYEIIRNRLAAHRDELRKRLAALNDSRREVFGSIETKLVANERITTENNCVPRGMIALGQQFLFGYNVQLGLRSEMQIGDVFSAHRFEENGFLGQPLDLLADEQFAHDFKQLYRYYKNTRFAKFFRSGPHLYLVFHVGRSATDIKAFKFLVEGESLAYLDNRSDHEVRYPPQHEFEWIRTHRELHREGVHPHVSIEDRLFVETVGGDLTIKIEDNTTSGEGLYAEPVDDPDQTLDDAEIFYAIVGNLILLKVRPYKEEAFRYFVYSEKVRQARRLDVIQDACVLLPEGHGLIFSRGYYLQNGEYKTFESGLSDLVFERRIAAANGEDYLYVFYNRSTGVHVLLSYNVIDQQVATPIICHGYAFFENGKLIYFKGQQEPQKHHAVQIWQTPYVGPNYVIDATKDSYLYKLGNKDIVRAMAECQEIVNLIGRDESYANLYVDLVKRATDVLDAYFWLGNEAAFNLAETLGEIRSAATAAVDEFDKVVRVRRNTQETFDRVAGDTRKLLSTVHSRRYETIDDFVASLADLRQRRGEIIGLRDLRYIDRPAVDGLEKKVQEDADRLAARCVDFLLRDDALAPYETKVAEQHDRIESLEKVADARVLGEEIAATAAELEMLIEVVGNLKIDDATQRTRIIDGISTIYSRLNQTRAALKKRRHQLLSVEGVAEFNAQMKLLAQAVTNYLDLCDAPPKCDEYLTRLMVQVEELEGRFAEFDEFVIQLAEKREEIYAAFDARKLHLVEARNKRAAALASAADRILGGIASRVGGLKEIAQIHAYFASDLMIDKVRDICRQLGELDDSVKIDDIQSRLKTIREDAVRQLKDRKELFEDGQNVIRFGKFRFNVNTQPLDLTTVLKDGRLCIHLTGTNYMEPVQDEVLLATHEVWDQEVVSENRQVYRAEYLAWQVFQQAGTQELPSLDEIATMDPARLVERIQQFMGPRYSEGYTKGVHDHDAARIVRSLAKMATTIGLLRYSPSARALAIVFWWQLDKPAKAAMTAKLHGVETIAHVFPEANGAAACRDEYIGQLHKLIGEFVERVGLFDPDDIDEAAGYLYDELSGGGPPVCSESADHIHRQFHAHLQRNKYTDRFTASLADLKGDAGATFLLLRNWVRAFLSQHDEPLAQECVDEVAALLLDDSLGGSLDGRTVLTGSATRELTGLMGSHPVINDGTYTLHYNAFAHRLGKFEHESVPRYLQYVDLKKKLVDAKRHELRLDEFKPRVLTSFVRNKLIDQVYLPLVGANLAKQMGVVGEEKRTDLMGLLLLISPPGYGKTTLMEYIANRLGITFVKINGPAIGHQVTSLDPDEAPNAAAREEVDKLNLALEMGDNVMIYLDDIQHCNPEFLQKFISLCDAQRKIEGVWQGRTRTYDLRGRKVCVVMAGNPYTESGAKFQIPDMLSNRADVYNLGDVIGETADLFALSHLENSLTSNATLAPLASRSQKDVYALIQMAQDDAAEGVDLEGNWSVEDLNEMVGVMRKLLQVRDVVLRVNEQYIASAAQADAYRTEPPFKLQGSYRDMNKMAERVVPIMNERELTSLIDSHYENSAQTLTTGAEANLLKLKELLGTLSPQEAQRWEDIKKTFRRNVLLGAAAGDDKFAQILAQMTTFSDGLGAIDATLRGAVAAAGAPQSEDDDVLQPAEWRLALGHLGTLNHGLLEIKQALAQGITSLAEARREKASRASEPPRPEAVEVAQRGSSFDDSALRELIAALQQQTQPELPPIRIVNKIPQAFLNVIRAQFDLMQSWVKPLGKLAESGIGDSREIKEAVDETLSQYRGLIEKLEEK